MTLKSHSPKGAKQASSRTASINAGVEHRKQQKALTPYPKAVNHTRPAQDRAPATSNGIRQIVSLSRLPTLDKRVKVAQGEIQLCWRLRVDDVRKLKMMFLLYEANGWTIEEVKP